MKSALVQYLLNVLHKNYLLLLLFIIYYKYFLCKKVVANSPSHFVDDETNPVLVLAGTCYTDFDMYTCTVVPHMSGGAWEFQCHIFFHPENFLTSFKNYGLL